MLTPLQLEQAAGFDLNYWYAFYNGICPNCGLDLKTCHPMYNLYPHFTAACKEQKAK